MKMTASIQLSQAQYAARISSWVSFCHPYGIHPLAPQEDDVLGWVGLFKNGRSAKTYVTALRWLFARMRAPITWDTPALQLLLRGSVKLSPAVKRAPAISGRWAAALALCAWQRKEYDNYLFAVLAFTFGFRVKAELLPLCFDALAEGGHSSIAIFRDEKQRLVLRVWLRRRKNAPNGAVLTRACSCRFSQVMCPVHALVRWMKATGNERQVGRLFPRACYTSFERAMRFLLRLICFPDAAAFSSHGFRRGMAQEILRRGGSLADVLAAGGWRSAAFLLYLDRTEVDEAAILDFLQEEDQGTARFEEPCDPEHALPSSLPDDVLSLFVPPAAHPEPSDAPPALGAPLLEAHPPAPCAVGRLVPASGPFARPVARPPAALFANVSHTRQEPAAVSAVSSARTARPVDSDCARTVFAAALGVPPSAPAREVSPPEVFPPCPRELLDEQPLALAIPEVPPTLLRVERVRGQLPSRLALAENVAAKSARGTKRAAPDSLPTVGRRRACRFLKPSVLSPSMAGWIFGKA